MAKKQTRRSISVSRNTYERLKAYCETNDISMSQFVERRVGDFLGSTTGLSFVSTVTRTVTSSDEPSAPAQPVKEADVDAETRAVAEQIFTF